MNNIYFHCSIFLNQFISNCNIVFHLLQDCLCPQSETTCNIHCHYYQGLLEVSIVDRKSYQKSL